MYKLLNLPRRIEQNHSKTSVWIPLPTRHSKAKDLSNRVLKFSVYVSVLNAFTQFIKAYSRIFIFQFFRVLICRVITVCGVTIYLLTAIELTPGGSSTVHIYTQTINTTTQWNRIYRTEHTYKSEYMNVTIRILKDNNKNT